MLLKLLKITLINSIIALGFLVSSNSQAADYDIDSGGMHAFIQFKVSHMGFSELAGRFNKFTGSFSWDKSNPSASSVNVTIDTASLDSNHEKRDAHLTSPDYLNSAKFPTATFKSTKYEGDASGGKMTGDFTLNGVTKQITIDATVIGEGKDPWGGYRAGFSGSTTLNGADYNYANKGFPKSIEISMGFEGKQKK